MTVPDRIGTHLVSREDDVVEMRFEGPISYEDMLAMRGAFRVVLEDHPNCFMVSDMTRCTALEPKARRFLAEWSRDRTDRVAGTAVYGVNFAMRALITLAIKAIRLIGQHEGDDIAFVKDAAEARRWVDERRIQVAAGADRGA